ncbi:MAG: MFS transporter [Betaproteobacteria bacterium]|nr:MFS transporter [Betaproteobacteria bacterium]
MLPYWRLSFWYFSYFAFIGAFSPYFSLYLQHLGHSAWDISILLSLMQVMRLAAPNLWGWLADRYGSKTRMVCGSAACSLVAFCGLWLTTSFAGLFVAIALLAFFWSAALPLVEALTLRHLQHQAERYSSIRLWGSVGFIVAVTGGGIMLDRLPMESLLWLSTLLLAGILVSALIVPEAAPESVPTPASPLGAALRQPKVLTLLAASFLMSAAHGPLYVFYSIHLVANDYGKTLVGELWAISVVAEILVFLWMPRLLQRHALRSILLACFACAVVRFLLIGWGVQSLAAILLAQLLHGATFGAYHAAVIATLHRWFPDRQQARAQALYGSVSFGAGGMLGSLLSGWTWGIYGAGWTYSIAALFALAGGLLVKHSMTEERS